MTRAIEKNRGLTPRRSKTGRNPRVKKRQAYEKAKRKVASQRAVFKGGQASLSGAYSGEKTGISTGEGGVARCGVKGRPGGPGGGVRGGEDGISTAAKSRRF